VDGLDSAEADGSPLGIHSFEALGGGADKGVELEQSVFVEDGVSVMALPDEEIEVGA
jgi:hypothetical protein